MMNWPDKILLFDGVCNLCNNSVQFVLKNDKKKETYFASLQSEVGQQILTNQGLSTQQLDSIIYYRNGKVWQQSTAALYLLKDMGGLWSLLFPLILIPAFIRNAVYNWVAKNRYKWFGQSDACMLPLPQYQKRFIDVAS